MVTLKGWSQTLFRKEQESHQNMLLNVFEGINSYEHTLEI